MTSIMGKPFDDVKLVPRENLQQKQLNNAQDGTWWMLRCILWYVLCELT